MDNKLYDEFYQLLEKFEQGIATPEEELLLTRWLNRLDELGEKDVFNDHAEYGQIKNAIFQNIDRKIGGQFPERVKSVSRNRWWLSAAASIILMMGVWAFFQYQKSAVTPVVYITKHAGQSELLQLTLPDSTQICLNAGSSIRFPERFTKANREVFLDGEAYFQVTHHPERPFIVHSGKVDTRVLGTKFLVKAYHALNNVEVHVTQGKVQVKDKTHLLALLVRNESVYYNKTDGTSIKAEYPNDAFAEMTQGIVHFRNATFDELRLRITNYYGLTMIAGTETISQLRFTGDLRIKEPLNIFLNKLCAVYGKEYHIKGKEIRMK